MDNIGLIILGVVFLVVFIASYRDNKKDKRHFPYDCFLDKLLLPISWLMKQINLDTSLQVDYIGDNFISINTKNEKLYGLKINSLDYISEELINKLFKKYKYDERGSFYQVTLKNGERKRHYVFSYCEELIDDISSNTGVERLTGERLVRAVKKSLFLDDNRKRLTLSDSLRREKRVIEKTFEVFQGYKAKDGDIEDAYEKLNKLSFNGSVWAYYDFFQGHINSYMDTELIKKGYDFYSSTDRVLMNFILVTNKIDTESLNLLADIFSISLVKKTIDGFSIAVKTPLKYRDVDWDLLVDLDYVSKQFIKKG